MSATPATPPTTATPAMPKTTDLRETAPPPTPVVSLRPIVLPAPERGEDLQVRVTAPASGAGLPIVVFSHGFGGSMNEYAPLVDFWAASGFAVVQPTHLDSRTLGLPPEDPRTPRIWRYRIEDLVRVLDNLPALETAVPGLTGRLDHGRIALAGHSWGAQSASALLGARVVDAEGVPGEDMTDGRVSAGVLLALTGLGDSLTPFAEENLPFMKPSFDDMRTRSLVVAGDNDQSFLSTRGPDWFTDPYTYSPGPKSLLTLFGAEHSLGGIYGQESTSTTDENPSRVALLQRLTTAFLRDALVPGDSGWQAAAAALEEGRDPLGRLRSK